MIAQGDELIRQFKAPSLRDVAEHAPYMDAGQFATLDQVIAHYNMAPAAPAGHSEIVPLNLSQQEMDQLVAFLGTLTGTIGGDSAEMPALADASVSR
jgi:cytochrome c peroxidase